MERKKAFAVLFFPFAPKNLLKLDDRVVKVCKRPHCKIFDSRKQKLSFEKKCVCTYLCLAVRLGGLLGGVQFGVWEAGRVMFLHI